MSIHRDPRVSRIAELFRDTSDAPYELTSARERLIEAQADALVDVDERERLRALVITWMRRYNHVSAENARLTREANPG